MQSKTFLKNNLVVLLILSLIGILVHFKSFQMVPYGDDWKFIYNYFTHEEINSNFSPFSGIFSYLAPYGPSVLTIGFLYQVFGKLYLVYYLVPLIFKILTSFFLLVTLRHISYGLKKNNDFTNFLSATLFLVGMTGIQAIDWSMNMNVYIGLSIFILSLFFQIKFYSFSGKLNILLGLFLSLSSIVMVPIRLSSLIFIVPLIDFIMLIKKAKFIYKVVLLKNIIFGIFIFIFWLIGVFGPGATNIYSPYPDPIGKLINLMISTPLTTLNVFLHWVGVIILPTYPASSITMTSLIGAAFLILLFLVILKYRNKYLIIGSVVFFLPLFLMWMITPLRIIDSADRYLPPAFLGLCLLIGILSLFIYKLKNIFQIIIILIILMQLYSVNKIYSYWLSIGRGANFISVVQKQIMTHFPSPIIEPRIIYLDFDNAAIQQSIEFGLGYRVAVLSGTNGIQYFPKLISNRQSLMKLIEEESKKGLDEKFIESISAFQFKDNQFRDITTSVQNEFIEKVKNNEI